MSGWQPIETAPLSTPILVLAKDICGRMGVFCVTLYAGIDIHGRRFSGCMVVGCGCQEGGTDFDYPTHWQPLPPPPELP